jgi:hypothetical protein
MCIDNIYSSLCANVISRRYCDCRPAGYEFEVIALSLLVETMIVTSCVTRRNTKVNADGQVDRILDCTRPSDIRTRPSAHKKALFYALDIRPTQRTVFQLGCAVIAGSEMTARQKHRVEVPVEANFAFSGFCQLIIFSQQPLFF